ncbi:MAG: ATP-binding cassette domain-containing protein [Thermoplasmata archaeon]
MDAIETYNITKKFGELIAIDHVNIQVKSGEIFGLLGPNGAGKSTLMRMLCTLTRPTEGTAKVAGYDIVNEDSMVREHIGLVSEKMIMYDRLTAKENLKLFAKLCNMPNDAIDKKIDELLKFVRMEKWANAQIGTFSTGMKQRINVIRALIHDPNILFLDEPTLGLDPQSTSEIRELIRTINKDKKTTIVLTTHMMVEADMLCSRIGIIDKGKVVAIDAPLELKRKISTADTVTVDLTLMNLTNEMVDSISKLSCVASVVREGDTRMTVRAKGEDALDIIIDEIRKHNWKISSITKQEPTLEDVFLHLTGHEVREEVKDKVPMGGHRHGPPGSRGFGGSSRGR